MSKLNKYSLMLLLLSPVLTACQSNSALQNNVCPQLPERPVMSIVQRSETYSSEASKNIQKWQDMLMNTELMKKN